MGARFLNEGRGPMLPLESPWHAYLQRRIKHFV